MNRFLTLKAPWRNFLGIPWGKVMYILYYICI
jgi:hypothetical protein